METKISRKKKIPEKTKDLKKDDKKQKEKPAIDHQTELLSGKIKAVRVLGGKKNRIRRERKRREGEGIRNPRIFYFYFLL